jgi:hypothetical protein
VGSEIIFDGFDVNKGKQQSVSQEEISDTGSFAALGCAQARWQVQYWNEATFASHSFLGNGGVDRDQEYPFPERYNARCDANSALAFDA